MHSLEMIPAYFSVRLHPESVRTVSLFYSQPDFREFNPLDPYNLHVSIMTSVTSLPDPVRYALTLRPQDIYSAKITQPKMLGDWSVLGLECPALVERYKTLQRLGMTSRFPEFIPHMSFAKTPLTARLERLLQLFEGKTIKLHQESVTVG